MFAARGVGSARIRAACRQENRAGGRRALPPPPRRPRGRQGRRRSRAESVGHRHAPEGRRVVQQLSDRRRVGRRDEEESDADDVPRADRERGGDGRQRPPRVSARRFPDHARRQGAVRTASTSSRWSAKAVRGSSPSSRTRRCLCRDLAALRRRPFSAPIQDLPCMIRLLASTSMGRCSTDASRLPDAHRDALVEASRAASRSRWPPGAAFISPTRSSIACRSRSPSSSTTAPW